MKNKDCNLCFVERLTVVLWIFYVLPYLLRQYLGKEKKLFKVYFVHASRLGLILARVTVWIINSGVEEFQFRLVDIKNENGVSERIRSEYEDLGDIQQDVFKSRIFHDALRSRVVKENNMSMFLAKKITSYDWRDDSALWRVVFLILAIQWRTKLEKGRKVHSVLIMSRRLWVKEIYRYAQEHGVEFVAARWQEINLKKILINLIGNREAKGMYHYFEGYGFWRLLRQLIFIRRDLPVASSGREASPLARYSSQGQNPSLPKLMTEYCGHLNLNSPQLHSDLFFWQQSSLKGENIVVTFSSRTDPLDHQKQSEMAEHKISAIALHPKATTLAGMPVFRHWPRVARINPPSSLGLNEALNAPEQSWIKKCTSDYYKEFDYWTQLFGTTNTKVFVSWHKYTASDCVIHNALQQLGGVKAVYQRSFEGAASALLAVTADIVFAFSPLCVELEKQANSTIPYHIVTGYSGDYRFSLFEREAQQIRANLKKNGAKRIIAYLDENSGNDPRWHSGHEFMQHNFIFLLNKVLENPWLGLVIKPKAPLTLDKRLGDVAELLQKAKDTGRCFVFETATMFGSYPPSMASRIADITIHGHLCAGTAGIESALSGAPTLLMDREGWPNGLLHDVDNGRSVFTDWKSLWKACEEHWKIPGGRPGFGDWSNVIDKIDPFRDGRAAERMGTFLKWILDGYEAKLPKDTVLADAAQRYADLWGKDKVNAINCEVYREPVPA